MRSMFTWFSDDNVYGLTVNPDPTSAADALG